MRGASAHLITTKAERDGLDPWHARRNDLGQALVGDLAGGLILGHDIRDRQVVRGLVVLDLIDLLVDIDRGHVIIVLLLFLRHSASDRRLGLGLALVWSARRELRPSRPGRLPVRDHRHSAPDGRPREAQRGGWRESVNRGHDAIAIFLLITESSTFLGGGTRAERGRSGSTHLTGWFRIYLALGTGSWALYSPSRWPSPS